MASSSDLVRGNQRMPAEQRRIIGKFSWLCIACFMICLYIESEFVRKFRAVLLAVQNDEIMGMGSERTQQFVEDIQILVRKLASPTDSDIAFLDWLYESLKKVLGEDRLHKKELWTKFHVLRSTEDFSKRWVDYLKENGIQSKAVFIQTLSSEVFEQIINDKTTTESTHSEIDAATLTFEEENAIRYMAGYVVHKLQKKLQKEKVEMLIEADQTAIQDSNSTEWISIIDRGGLVHVTDECYQLFLAIEHATRQEMHLNNITCMDDTFRKRLEDMLNSDDDILFGWTMITGDETENEDVLHEITKLWVTIRGFSFAKSIMEKYRAKTKKRTSKSKGFRTKLFTDKV